jgi:uncharacterized protein (DUF1330 family)
MKLKLLGLAVASGFVGLSGGTFLHAQTAVPAAYLNAEVQVTDADTFKEYLAALPGTMAPYKVRTLARNNAVPLDSATPPAANLAVLAFNSMEDLKARWNSPAYQAIIPLREKSAKTRIDAVQGMPPH